jgi:hypothetical protein
MFILYGACGVWITNAHWQTHLKKTWYIGSQCLVSKSRKIPSVLSLNILWRCGLTRLRLPQLWGF